MIPPVRRPFLALFCLTTFCHAAEETVSTELLTLAFNGSFPGYYYLNGKEVLKLEASRQGISAPVSYRGPGTLRLYAARSDLDPPKEGASPPQPALTALLPAGNDRVLIVFAYSREKERLPGVKTYGISTKSMKEGDYRLLNFSKQPVYAVLNGGKTVVAPGAQSDISAASWKRSVQDMEVSFGLQTDGTLRPVYSSVWGHQPARRNFIFLFDRPDKHRPLDVRMFYDVPSISAARRKGQSSTETPPDAGN